MRYGELLERTRDQLESGALAPEALERLLNRSAQAGSERPDMSAVLVALGLAVAYGGVAVVYGIAFDGLSWTAKLLTPFIFPAVATGCAIALNRAGRPRWQVEAAGMIGQASLAAAFLVLGGVIDPANIGLFGAICGIAATVEVLVVHLELGSERLTGWGAGGSLVAAAAFAASATLDASLAVIFLGEALVAAAVAAALIRRRSCYAPHAARTAALLAYASAMLGIEASSDRWSHLDGWHLVLTVAVVATFITAAAFRYDSLVWVGGLGGVIWLGAVADIAGGNTGAASMIVLGGVGLVGLGLLIRAVRGITHAAAHT